MIQIISNGANDYSWWYTQHSRYIELSLSKKNSNYLYLKYKSIDDHMRCFSLHFNTIIEVKFAIKKKTELVNKAFFGKKWRKISIRSSFLIILKMDARRAIPKTPIYYIFWINIFCVFIKSYWATQNFDHVAHWWGLKIPAKFSNPFRSCYPFGSDRQTDTSYVMRKYMSFCNVLEIAGKLFAEHWIKVVLAWGRELKLASCWNFFIVNFSSVLFVC